MAFTQDWKDADELLPTDSEQVKLGPDKIRDFKIAVRERLQIDHEFGEAQSGVDTGFHKRVMLKVATPGTPGANYVNIGAAVNKLYYKGQDGTLRTVVNTDETQALTNKTLTSSKIDAVIDQSGLAANGLKTVALEIGDWNMNSTPNLDIDVSAYNTYFISGAEVWIRNDTNTVRYPLAKGFSVAGGTWQVGGSVSFLSGGNTFRMSVLQNGIFDNTNYDATPFNRGWVMFWYKA